MGFCYKKTVPVFESQQGIQVMGIRIKSILQGRGVQTNLPIVTLLAVVLLFCRLSFVWKVGDVSDVAVSVLFVRHTAWR
jgi:hypothetical protein